LDYQVVPEAGLEPAQAFTRGILSPLRLPIPPLRRPSYFKSLNRYLASGETKKPAEDPHELRVACRFGRFSRIFSIFSIFFKGAAKDRRLPVLSY
jgi:hypothetical protein